MKKIITILIVTTTIFLLGCKKKTEPTIDINQIIQTAQVNHEVGQLFVENYKKDRESRPFLVTLYQKVNKIAGADFKLLRFDETKLYGSEDFFYIAEVDETNGKHTFLLTKNGTILYDKPSDTHDFVYVLDDYSFLVLVEKTANGKSIHHFIGIENDIAKDFLNASTKDVLEAIGTQNNNSTATYEIKDINTDNIKDIVFTCKNTNNKTYTLNFIWDGTTKCFGYKK